MAVGTGTQALPLRNTFAYYELLQAIVPLPGNAPANHLKTQQEREGG